MSAVGSVHADLLAGHDK